MSKAVVELLAGGYVERSSEPPTVCSPLSVVVSGAGKKRLVVNLRHVNQYFWKQKFKYEDLQVAMTMFSKDVFSAGDWPLTQDMQKPELQQLAAGLPDVVLSGRADSTNKKYLGAFQRWKVWAESMEIVPSFPVKGMHLALYMQHLNTAKHSRSAVEEVVHALAWVHKMAGIESPTESPLLQSVLEGLRRILSKPKVRKEPVSIEMSQAMVEAAGPTPSLSDVRLLAVC